MYNSVASHYSPPPKKKKRKKKFQIAATNRKLDEISVLMAKGLLSRNVSLSVHFYRV